jgi:ribosome maturation protein Sdo1
VRQLDLAAAGALQVAGEQRRELDEQRELLIASQLLTHQVGPDAQRLT